jgi:hypothetical protein
LVLKHQDGGEKVSNKTIKIFIFIASVHSLLDLLAGFTKGEASCPFFRTEGSFAFWRKTLPKLSPTHPPKPPTQKSLERQVLSLA